MLPEPVVITKGVNHRYQPRRRSLQAVNENHRSPCGIEWLQLSQSGRVRVLLWIYYTCKSEPLRSLARDQHRGGRIKIDGQRESSFADRDALRFHRIDKFQLRSFVREFNYRRHRCVNTTKLKLLARPRMFYATYSNQQRTDSAYRRTRFGKMTADFQAVGRKQIVSTRIVFPINGLRSRKQIVCLIDSY